MAGDVLHDDDGVVHEYADSEHKGKQRDPVEGVPEQPVHQERQGQRNGHGDEHHCRLPPTQRHPNEQAHAERGHDDVHEKFPRLLGRGFSVVPRHGDAHVLRDQVAAEFLDEAHRFTGYGGGIGPFALGDGYRDRRLEILRPPPAGQKTHVALGLGGPVGDTRDVPQQDRAAVHDTDDHRAHLLHVPQQAPDAHRNGPVARHDPAGRELHVRHAELVQDGGRGQSSRR